MPFNSKNVNANLTRENSALHSPLNSRASSISRIKLIYEKFLENRSFCFSFRHREEVGRRFYKTKVGNRILIFIIISGIPLVPSSGIYKASHLNKRDRYRERLRSLDCSSSIGNTKIDRLFNCEKKIPNFQIS